MKQNIMTRITGLICCTILSVTPLLVGAGEDLDADDARLPLAELQLFAKVFEQIKSSYVEELNDKELLEKAIVGLLAELDPHSAFLDADNFEELKEQTSGEFGGIGIEVEMSGGLIKIISPIDDTPAFRAGIEPGDLILKLNDQSVRGMNLDSAIEIMRGEKGTTLLLTVARENNDQPLYFTLTRDIIKIRSVRHRWLEPGYGYIRIAQFQNNTGREFKDNLTKLTSAEQALKGMILDLRNNPGGLLSASISVADSLIEDGLIVYTEGRVAASSNKYFATPGDLLAGIPVVVLINGGSASASEIVAGAIQDHRRGVLLGTDSFGKGSVQNVLPLDDERAMKLTTARYFTPGGRSIQAAGIKPDIEVQKATLPTARKTYELREKNLSGHLVQEDNQQSESEVVGEDDFMAADNQLYEALNLLKGLDILSHNLSREDEPTGKPD
jgi:carboxyl-terminal processing protease